MGNYRGSSACNFFNIYVGFFSFCLFVRIYSSYDFPFFDVEAVPKRILELMNVEKLTRENVASHLQVNVLHTASPLSFKKIKKKKEEERRKGPNCTLP